MKGLGGGGKRVPSSWPQERYPTWVGLMVSLGGRNGVPSGVGREVGRGYGGGGGGCPAEAGALTAASDPLPGCLRHGALGALRWAGGVPRGRGPELGLLTDHAYFGANMSHHTTSHSNGSTISPSIAYRSMPHRGATPCHVDCYLGAQWWLRVVAPPRSTPPPHLPQAPAWCRPHASLPGAWLPVGVLWEGAQWAARCGASTGRPDGGLSARGARWAQRPGAMVRPIPGTARGGQMGA